MVMFFMFLGNRFDKSSYSRIQCKGKSIIYKYNWKKSLFVNIIEKTLFATYSVIVKYSKVGLRKL